jgi:hypothetical protein
MFWTLIVITLLPANVRQPDGIFSTYEIISRHEERIDCEYALFDYAKKFPSRNNKQTIACIKTDEFYKRLTDSSTH